MKWVTRRQIRVNRTATAWLVRRFIDADATFLFVEPERVAEVQQRDGAIGFDAPGARYPHKDEQGRCSFEALVDEHCGTDLALRRMARIVRSADFADQISLTPEGAGLRASPGASLSSRATTMRPWSVGRSSTMRYTRRSVSKIKRHLRDGPSCSPAGFSARTPFT